MAKANLAARHRRPGDDAGAFPILEAVFVAVLIITTIIFFTSLQRPTTGTDVGGIDLGRLASDTLDILQTKEFTRATCPQLGDGAGLEVWVGLVVNGSTCTDHTPSDPHYVADEVETFLAEVLPPGTQFQLRLDNGVGATSDEADLYADSLVLVPATSPETPRAARAASTYITPPWTAFKGRIASQFVYPGQEVVASQTNATAFLTASSVLCVQSPTGSSTGPAGVTWRSVWQPTPATGRVPSTLPYGTWAGYGNAACTGTPTYLHVGLRDGTKTDYPVMALQLVVWFGA